MIGGIDIIIKTRSGADAMDVALRLARRIWPQMVVEDAATGERASNVAALALDQAMEILVYRDALAAEQWDAHGAIPVLDGTMIHLIRAAEALTITVDARPGLRVSNLLMAIRDALRHSIFNATASRRAAA